MRRIFIFIFLIFALSSSQQTAKADESVTDAATGSVVFTAAAATLLASPVVTAQVLHGDVLIFPAAKIQFSQQGNPFLLGLGLEGQWNKGFYGLEFSASPQKAPGDFSFVHQEGKQDVKRAADFYGSFGAYGGMLLHLGRVTNLRYGGELSLEFAHDTKVKNDHLSVMPIGGLLFGLQYKPVEHLIIGLDISGGYGGLSGLYTRGATKVALSF